MKAIRYLLVLSLACTIGTTANAGLFLLDFAGDGANSSGAAPGWDAFNSLDQDVSNALTDRSGGGDNDVTLTALDDNFLPNNPAPPGVGAVYDGITVPKEAVDDYFFKADDTAGTTARMRIDNLDPGPYNVTVFEGRTTDSGQFAKIWVGDSSGSGEPATENTGNFAHSFSTVNLSISSGDVLWYKHLEDNTGGISGMIINPVPEPGTLTLLAIGLLSMLGLRRRK